MTPAEFVKLCPTLWHVAAPGAWDRIRQHGFLTASQIIERSTLSADERQRLVSTPRRTSIELDVEGTPFVLRDQGPLLKKKDLDSILEEGMTTADWLRLLDDRVYFFAQRTHMEKLRDKYALLNDSVEVITLSPLGLVKAAGDLLELANQNTGAVARTKERYKTRDTFKPLSLFPARRPNEVTVRGGLPPSSLNAVLTVVRWHSDGRSERLAASSAA